MRDPEVGAARAAARDKTTKPKRSDQGAQLHPLLIHFDKLADTVNVPAEEAAMLLNCSLPTLYRYCRNDLLRPIKMADRLTFKVGNLREVMKNGIPSKRLEKRDLSEVQKARKRNAAARRTAREEAGS